MENQDDGTSNVAMHEDVDVDVTHSANKDCLPAREIVIVTDVALVGNCPEASVTVTSAVTVVLSEETMLLTVDTYVNWADAAAATDLVALTTTDFEPSDTATGALLNGVAEENPND